jgi:poly-gamma-glutamate synthase PgsB/CapB
LHAKQIKMFSFYIISFLLFGLLIFGGIEYSRHQNLVLKIPIRIHVNGTRGKSSVTRMIGAGLRAGGINTITKVTGTYPRLILNDGNEAVIHRKEKANILEQLKIIKYGVAHKADAVIIECMALQPIYQIITERQMIHATIGIITNVRLDHLDVMGPGLMDVAKALSATIPANQHFFTAENRIYPYLEKIAAEKKCIPVQSDEKDVSDEEMAGFTYIEHRENVALALSVCKHLGVNRKTALKGMYAAIPDEGVLTKIIINRTGKRITFFNAFAANDPESSLMIWRNIMKQTSGGDQKIVMLNTREDRLDRARQLTEMAGTSIAMDYLVLVGQRSEIVKDMALKNNIPEEKIINIGWAKPENVFEKVLSVISAGATIVAIGNMGGMGADIVKYFELMSKIEYHG